MFIGTNVASHNISGTTGSPLMTAMTRNTHIQPGVHNCYANCAHCNPYVLVFTPHSPMYWCSLHVLKCTGVHSTLCTGVYSTLCTGVHSTLSNVLVFTPCSQMYWCSLHTLYWCSLHTLKCTGVHSTLCTGVHSTLCTGVHSGGGDKTGMG